MSPPSKVVWKEGMFLQPQHFQQAERYLLATLGTRLGALAPWAYGFFDMQVDTEALAGGVFSLSRCSGIFADGTPFSIPQDAPPPQTRSFGEHFSLDRPHLDVYLALPSVVEGRASVSGGEGPGAASARYRSVTCELTDESLGSLRRDIECAVPQIAILFDTEARDNCSSLRVARLVRDPSGAPTLDDSVAPALLRIGAHRPLMDEIRKLLQMLMATITTLSQSRRQEEGGIAGFSSAEEGAFRLLLVLNTYTPLLAHHHYTAAVHPYELFTLLSQLTGALCTFSSRLSIASLPRYEHEQCGATFRELVAAIREIVGADRGGGCRIVAVEPLGRASFRAAVADRALFSRSRFFLGVRAPVSEKELVVGVVQRIKICSPERIELLIASAMPGLRLMHTTAMPEDAAVKPGYVYFSLEQQGEFWDGIVNAGSLSFYFPHEYPELAMELLVVRTAGNR